jgi:hypothetical protein
MLSISSCFLTRASLGGLSHSVLTRFGDEDSLLGPKLFAIVSSSRALFEPDGAEGVSGATLSGVAGIFLDDFRLVGATAFGLRAGLDFGDFAPWGEAAD